MNGERGGDNKAVKMEEAKQSLVFMCGYLPGASPQRSPLISPVLVRLPPSISSGDSWKGVCRGGCGFAMAISESGKLITWGSTDDLGQSYLTSGKHGEIPEPFPLPTEASIVTAAAGWAHCVSVTDRGEVYTWGWKECVPSGKVIGDSSTGPSLEKDILERQNSMLTEQVSPRSQSPRSATGTVSSFDNRGSGEESTKRRRISSAKQAAESSTSGDETLSALPCLVDLSPRVRITTVAAGGRHTLALSDIGQVWGWGYGGEGQLGLGSRIRMVSSPHPVPCIESSGYGKDRSSTAPRGSINAEGQVYKIPGTYVKGIACGGRHSAVITDVGALLTFGWGLYGQVPATYWSEVVLTTAYLFNRMPSCVLGFKSPIELSGCHTFVVHRGLRCIFLGYSPTQKGYRCYHPLSRRLFVSMGELSSCEECGRGSTDDELSPACVSALLGIQIQGVAAGLWHTVCISVEGDVYAFGGNQFGQLGTGADQAETLPRLLDAPSLENKHAKIVSCGARHSAVITEDGKVFCWGWNKYGQLGLGDVIDRNIPAQVPIDGCLVKNVACGWWHTLVLAESPT
ncbi:ultraviolet-B receptor UVR8-like isoform X2 [Macadamia integrifolia]|uniref:ultraviolet-B receptor UVR8-like isoform X2 n=1 Tax=Macadamia integrifolia TaxID=60698 RepID=UPI001C4F388E|nr:ultraviolet-B receptor UVR8-like isoform X2 [Macadamia integrifolia]